MMVVMVVVVAMMVIVLMLLLLLSNMVVVIMVMKIFLSQFFLLFCLSPMHATATARFAKREAAQQPKLRAIVPMPPCPIGLLNPQRLFE